MPTAEVQTTLIVHAALKTGKRVFIPYCYKRSTPVPGTVTGIITTGKPDRPNQPRQIMDMLELHSLSDYESLELDSWGIPTPSVDSLEGRKNCFGGWGKSEDLEVGERNAEDELDLIITPGLGFDRELGRIGRGMGFYDCFFERCAKFSKNGKLPWKSELSFFFHLCTLDLRCDDGISAVAFKMSPLLLRVVHIKPSDAGSTILSDLETFIDFC